MTLNYHMESSHVAEYDLYTLPGVDFTLRGPQWPLHASTPSISFLGAAQTFGAFCKYPFPNLLGEMLSARVLNFGRGGAGPGFYSKQQAVLDYVNSTDCCVVQVMSARSSVENAYMSTVEGLTKVEMLKGSKKGQIILGHAAYKDLANELPREEFHALVAETRETFIKQFELLASQITVPKILVYVGRNAPLKDLAVDEKWQNNELIGLHPHMISESVVARVSEFFDQTILSHGALGFDQKMMNRFTGENVSIKRSETYTVTRHNAYISPYLQTKTALSLYRPINEVLAKRR
ncbi:DUF6473 family protein [Shimia thalassica]|uniref:DUF6473 family protein n=1 Tax=Shimia thalassica TaxID=1715693 RepID=UPI0024959FAC|nr:DUF6473 family protein [Shimia thalassica]MDO6484948.1 DUF6473 family protein [Shimia thalassica]